MLTINGHITPADKASSDYYYLAFDVPPGSARFDVRYAYSHPRLASDLEGQGNTIDIGIFDAHGHEFLNPKGFRGWSGSDRSHIWVGETPADTTPGYLAGPIAEGRWHVILGLYHIAPEGCDYHLTIEFTPRALDSTALPPSANGTVANDEKAGGYEAGWYRGDLQSHTHHSDGIGSLATLVETARGRGLDFLAVTDHNTISHIREFDSLPASSLFSERSGRRLLLIPATEVTTYYGHMNVWGLRDWIDFRCRDAGAMNQIIAAAHQQRCLASVNHPKTNGPPWEYGSELDFDCIEVWQKPWPVRNTESLALWESVLKQGRRVTAVGGSDYHQPAKAMEGNPHLPGNPTTWVYAADFTVAGILDGIRHGRVFISADVDGPQLHFTASDGERTYRTGDVSGPASTLDMTCRVQGAPGCFARLIADGDVAAELPVDSADWKHTWRAQPRAAKYVRAEVVIRQPGSDEWAMAACSNPIYF